MELYKKYSARRCAGMTVLELLVTLVIAGMVISLAMTGNATAEKRYDEAKQSYDAQVMAERIIKELDKQVRFAENPVVEDERIRCYSRDGEIRDEICVDTWIYEEERAVDSELYLCRVSEDQPVFAMGDSGRFIEVSFGICDKDGKILVRVEGKKIRLLNP